MSVADSELDRHLVGCPGCREWEAAASALSRRLRVHAAVRVPDLADRVLADRRSSAEPARPRRSNWWRYALGSIGFLQLSLGLAQLLGVDHTSHLAADPGATHLFNESAAWNVAVAVGFLVSAFRPVLARGLLPALGVFVLALGFVSVLDLAGGHVDVPRVAGHLLVVGGVLLLLMVDRGYRRGGADRAERRSRTRFRPVPAGRSADEPRDRRTGRPDGRHLRPAGRRAA